MGAGETEARTAQGFVGSWLLSVGVGMQPSPLPHDLSGPLDADAVAAFMADGTAVGSISPSYPVPDESIRTDRLYVGACCGSWELTGDRTATVRGAALLYVDSGESAATLFVDATLELDPDEDTFSGPYTVEVHLTRGWTRNLPSLDGSIQGWRVGAPIGARASDG